MIPARLEKMPVSQVNRPSRKPLSQTAQAVFEKLETRQLMSAVALPFRLDFDAPGSGSVYDRNGRATGFDGVQVNKDGTQYRPDLIDMDANAGVLNLTSAGSSSAGSNAGSDNTQVNALESTFDSTTNGFAITTRLIGPLSNINANYQQAGLYFGPDQDNFIKLVAVNLSSSNGQYLQFKDETNTGSGPTSSLSDTQNRLSIGSFSSINTLDLRLVGNASTGTVSAYYSVNGGGFTSSASITPSPAANVPRSSAPAARRAFSSARRTTSRRSRPNSTRSKSPAVPSPPSDPP